MSRSLLLSTTAALLFALAGSAQTPARKSAFDKATLESYVRHLWVLGPEFTVAVSEPKASALLPGFKDVTVKISQGAMSQQVALMISDDGARIVQGNVFDINSNPFKPDLDRLKTQFEPSVGTPGAPVVLVEFSDFECPYCKTQAEMLTKNLLQTYPTQVRFYFKNFPLESIHPWAKPAAIAGRCVFSQNAPAFWQYHDWIFSHQEGITPGTLKSQVMDWAKGQKDIDALKLAQCIDEKATEKEVDANVAEGRALNLEGTPALFVNGRRIPAGTEWNNLKRIIDNEIEYQKTAKNAGEDCNCETKLDAPGLPVSQAVPRKPAATPKKK